MPMTHLVPWGVLRPNFVVLKLRFDMIRVLTIRHFHGFWAQPVQGVYDLISQELKHVSRR